MEIEKSLQEEHVKPGDCTSIVPNEIKTLKKLDGLPIVKEEDTDFHPERTRVILIRTQCRVNGELVTV